MHHSEQIGTYMLELKTPTSFWTVRKTEAKEYMGRYNLKSEAKTAIQNFEAADKRRKG